MTAFKDRTGDFTKKKHLYKFYKNGYTSRNPKYITAGQYMGGVGTLVSGTTSGSASVSGGVTENQMVVVGTGDPNTGLSVIYKVATDPRRKFDIDGFMASFSHSTGASGMASSSTYEVQLFDYILRWTASGNTLRVFYKTTQLVSVTMAAAYSYIRMRELGGVFYIDRSSDGITWTSWTSRTINKATDTLRTDMSLLASLGAGGNGMVNVAVLNIEAVDRRNNLLAVESQVLSDLEFNESINNPASVTSVVLPYSPLAVPEHCDEGNFVEIYTNFYDDGVIKNEPILDHNGDQILDENSQPIYGVVLHGNVPEQASILKFSGYINAIDYDYDNETIELSIVSHGETMANSLMRDGNTSVPLISQLTYNSLQSSAPGGAARRQSFTLTRMTKLDAIRLRVQYGAGGSSWVAIGRGNTTLATTNVITWSGGLPETDLVYDLPASLYLEAGTYWLQEMGQINWQIIDTERPYTGGYVQIYDAAAGSWWDFEGSAYFVLYTTQLQTALTLTGTSQEVANSIFAKSLDLDYSPLYLEEVQPAGYSIDVGLNLDSAKNAVAALYRQLPTGWFYHVDVGTGGVRIKNKSADPDHLLVFGRDFTEMKVKKDIDGIINDVYYIGAALTENGPKLTVRSFDTESMSDLRQGLSIQSNDKVTRYDTAALLSQNIIANNNGKRISTGIELSAAKYNIDSIRSGDVVKIVNGDVDVLGMTLVVATLRYNRNSVTISLDSAPRNISRTIDQLNRQLENMQTANAGSVI